MYKHRCVYCVEGRKEGREGRREVSEGYGREDGVHGVCRRYGDKVGGPV